MVEIPADEHETCDGDDYDEREDESIFRETLPFLAVKAEEHVASFR
jgi:hypothetical protein